MLLNDETGGGGTELSEVEPEAGDCIGFLVLDVLADEGQFRIGGDESIDVGTQSVPAKKDVCLIQSTAIELVQLELGASFAFS